MSTLRQSGNFWILWVATIVLACFSDAVAQTSYTVTDFRPSAQLEFRLCHGPQ